MSRFRLLSGAELSKMMIEMFISHDGPLDRRHRSEEAMRVCGASFRSSRRKMVNHLKQTLLLRGKPPLAYYNQALVCRHVPTDRIFAQNGFLRHLSEKIRSGRRSDRSEEHTSELQSPDHLVCLLLHSKKKTETE